MASRKGSTYSKNAVLEVFGLLWEETDYQHGLSISQIYERLIERHEDLGDYDYRPPSERTIREQLNWLSDPSNTILNRPIRKVSIAECEREGITDYTPGWYMTSYLSVSEMRILADSLMLSRINNDMIEDINGKLSRISGGDSATHRELEHIPAFEHYNPDFLHTIEGLDQAIGQGWSVDFEYCDYDSEGKLVPERYGEAIIKHYIFDPYRTVYKNGHYYVLGHLHGANDLSYFMADRIRNLQVLNHTPMEINQTQWQQDGTLRPACDGTPQAKAILTELQKHYVQGLAINRGGAFDPVRFTRERPYPTTEMATTITMVIRDSMLSNLYEWFDDPHIIDQCYGNYVVQVVSSESAMLQWALQYSTNGNVYIVQPQSLRNKMRSVGQHLNACYGAKSTSLTSAGNGSFATTP